MKNSHQVIYTSPHLIQAQMIVELLADEGIEARVVNIAANLAQLGGGEHLLGMGGDGLDAGPSVIVRHEDADAARFIAREAEDSLREGLTHLDASTPDGEWPDCPACGRPRLASCPVCQTSGTDFPEAFMPDGVDDDGLLVICPTCDEPFAPRFLARCEWCGHRFSDGIEPRPVNLHAPPPFLSGEMNSRASAVVIGLALLAAAVVGWFYFVLHQSGG